MKRRFFLAGYVTILGMTLTLQSCQDDPIVPNISSTNGVDTTWVTDSTSNSNNNGNDSDSTYIDNGSSDSTIIDNGGGNNTSDSTDWDDDGFYSGDSTNYGG